MGHTEFLGGISHPFRKRRGMDGAHRVSRRDIPPIPQKARNGWGIPSFSAGYPTHSAKSAEWMGHTEFLGGISHPFRKKRGMDGAHRVSRRDNPPIPQKARNGWGTPSFSAG